MVGYTLVFFSNFSKVQILNFLNFTKTSSRELVSHIDALAPLGPRKLQLVAVAPEDPV
jgi:hypothetical protein